jgi:hypothetical protein
VPFAGAGNKVGGATAAPEGDVARNTNVTGQKRLVVKEGRVQVAKGLSDQAAEREKRAAAALARLGQS